MAFSDPQSVTIDGTANSLPRTSSGENAGSFTAADGHLSLKVSHLLGKRFRRTIRIDHQKVASDPFNSSLNAKYSMSCYIVVDVPAVGYTIDEQAKIVAGLTKYLTDSSGARVTQLLGGEN